MTVDTILTFVHLLSASIILGGEIYLQLIIYPILTKGLKEIKSSDKITDVFDATLPCTFFLSVLLLLTGILTVFKQYSYFKNVSGETLIILGTKVLSSIIILGLSSYQTFSLRLSMKGISLTASKDADTKSIVQRIRSLSLIILAILTLAIIMGITIG